jgi:putative transposase
MPRGQKFPLEVMLRAMREVDNGVPVSVVCRKVGMVEKTFYRYCEKYQGMEPTEARRLGELEEENSKLKKRLSEQMLHNEALRDVLSKDSMKWLGVPFDQETSTWTTSQSTLVLKNRRCACVSPMG